MTHRLIACTPILALASLTACIEQFVPEVPAGEGELVVEGYVSDQAGNHQVRLSRARPLDSPEATAETGASVSMLDDGGRELAFEESAPGVYTPADSSFRGSEGAVYTLTIVTADGNHYQSNPEVLRHTPPIDSVYFEPDTRLTDAEGATLTGISVFLDTHDPASNTRHYKWKWEETWEIKMTYPNAYVWIPGPNPLVPGHPEPNPSPNIRCYDSEASTQMLIYSTNTLAQDQVSQFEIKFTSTVAFKLSSLYSINVRQYALSEAQYRYWREIDRINESQGTLFDPQPYAVQGNIGNVNNPDETVLGYFEARSVREQRLFVTRNQLTDVRFPSNECFYERVDSVNYWNVPVFLEAGYLVSEAGGFMQEFVAVVPRYCADCTEWGVLQKPEFFP